MMNDWAGGMGAGQRWAGMQGRVSGSRQECPWHMRHAMH